MPINYQNIISDATNRYNSTLQGYQRTLQQQQQAQAGVMAGYNQLQANVLQGLQGSSDAARQQIVNQYTAEAGKQQMGLISRGLGNTTIQNSILRGLNESQALAQTDRLNKYANTAAGYQSQLGLAGLNYAGNALNTNLQFAGQGLQYEGQGAQGIGQLAQGFAGFENQAQMQKDALAQQLQLARLHAGGGGGISSYGGDNAGGKPGGGGGGAPGTYSQNHQAPDPWISLNQGKQQGQPGGPAMMYGAAQGANPGSYDLYGNNAYTQSGGAQDSYGAPYAGGSPGGMTNDYSQGWDEGTGE